MEEEKLLTGEESLQLITGMIKKAKNSFHDSGTSMLLWGSCVSVAALVTYLQLEFNFSVGFNIWLIILFAVVPQVFITIRENRRRKVVGYDGYAINVVWSAYAFTICGLVIYESIVPSAFQHIIQNEGWQLTKHYLNQAKPDEVLEPFTLSITSIYILIYAFPTIIMGRIRNYKPMITGAIIAYALFVASCFTATKYDMIFACIAAIACWLIPGVILRNKYLKQKANV